MFWCDVIIDLGLDIGEVDLIVLFDSVSSPIRLVQRMGRTGRKRAGRVIMLIAEGKEEGKLEKSDSTSKAISQILKNPGKSFSLYKKNPSVIPAGIEPLLVQQEMEDVSEFHMSQVAGGGRSSVAASNSSLSNLAHSSGADTRKDRNTNQVI